MTPTTVASLSAPACMRFSASMLRLKCSSFAALTTTCFLHHGSGMPHTTTDVGRRTQIALPRMKRRMHVKLRSCGAAVTPTHVDGVENSLGQQPCQTPCPRITAQSSISSTIRRAILSFCVPGANRGLGSRNLAPLGGQTPANNRSRAFLSEHQIVLNEQQPGN